MLAVGRLCNHLPSSNHGAYAAHGGAASSTHGSWTSTVLRVATILRRVQGRTVNPPFAPESGLDSYATPIERRLSPYPSVFSGLAWNLGL